MIEQDIKLLDHCVLDLQHRVQALEAQIKNLKRRLITLELQAERKDEPFDKDINVRSKDEPKWTCERCGFENNADFIWCFKCGCHKMERS